MTIAPLVKTGFISFEIDLIAAGVIGFGFGFMLERAGFGSAKKLTDQWYGRDWSVFRVMFTAIVTTMFGILILDALNIMPLGSFYLNETYLHSQLLGGILVGVGFAIGGYCPGTSVVAIASGKIDAIFYLSGMMLGMLIFAEGWDLVENFMQQGNMGDITIPQWLDLNPWLVATVVLLIAVGGFAGANYVEKKLNT
ncbi:MAG: YeeE/YedE family protein [SAR324 cluster bacterium]|nr:YeeE/YedE family protein [SAR324 cluster bacterium]